MFKDDVINDYGVEWWSDNYYVKTAFEDNILETGGKQYGLQVVSSIFTRFGDSYQIAISKTNLISPFLKYDLKYKYFKEYYADFQGFSKSKKGKLTETDWLNFYRITEEMKSEAKELLSKIDSLISMQLATTKTPSILPINDIFSNLNSFIKNGIVSSGLTLEKVGQLLKDLLGGINFKDPNNLLYKICYNDVRNEGNEYKVSSLIIKKQSEKDWYKAWYQIFTDYVYQGKDYEAFIKSSGIKSKVPFSDGQYFDDNDLQLAKIIKELIVTIFGRFTFIAFRTGSLFAKDYNAQVIAHTWQAFFTHAKDTHISLLHDIIPQSRLGKLLSRNTYYRAQNILLDLYTLGIAENLQTGLNDFVVDLMPALPTERWAPLYKDATEISRSNLPSFYDFLSYITAREVFTIPDRQVDPFKTRVPGNAELYFTFLDIYEDKIDKAIRDNLITPSQKSMLLLMIAESLNFMIFADKGSVKTRGRLLEYFLSGGADNSKWFVLKLKVSGFPSTLEGLKAVKLDALIFNNYFQSKDVKLITDSLYPARIHPHTEGEGVRRTPYKGVVEYYTENILRAQRNEIVNFGNFLKKLVADLQNGHNIEICPFTTYFDGFAYSRRASYLTFFPDAENTGADQIFILNQESLADFTDDFIKILGGLLVDHQTFVLRETDSSGSLVQDLCAFNLLFGALSLSSSEGLNLYNSRPQTQDYVSAPVVANFDLSLYDSSDTDSIVNVMNSFKENGVLIGYQRIGDRRREQSEFTKICKNLMFIRYLFS